VYFCFLAIKNMSDTLVIIPTYNEIENIEKIIRAVLALERPFDILVVDDNSPDGTAAKVKELQSEFTQLNLTIRQKKEGLGLAYIHGFEWAFAHNYQVIIEMDADFSHDPKDLPRLYQALQDGADVAVGSRYVNGIAVVNWDMTRLMLSYFASKYVRFITRIPIKDTTAGFVAYKREVLEAINFKKIKFIGYAFQIEMKFKAWNLGYKVIEVPVIFTDRTAGQSKMHGGIIAEGVFGVIQMKWLSLFNKNKKK
jgi:dolichol-phosphate mannosyltransferase